MICVKEVECMLLRLFKNELCRGKLTNFAMVIFLTISSLLACTSISLLYSSTNQISYFMNEMGNTAELNFSMMNMNQQEEDKVINFLEEKNIQNYQIDHAISLPVTAMKFDGYEDVFSAGCFLTTLPEKYNLMFDENSEIPVIHEGEVGIPLSMKTQLGLEIGDTFRVVRGDQSFTYSIQSFTRDSLYGSEMMGQKRIVLHPNDYAKQEEAAVYNERTIVLAVKEVESSKELESQMQAANLANYILVTKDTANLSFMGVQAGTSAMMFVSGIILLCISFLIIRFTILFQLEENYTQIGIMKAIGLQYSHIKPLYVTKYMGLTLIGSFIGFLLSIPFSSKIEHMQAGIVPIMPGNTGTYLSISVIFFMLLLVYSVSTLVLRRLKKQSAMDAIRKGNEGETYQEFAKVSLKKRTRLPISLYLAGSDLLSQVKHAIMVVFMYGFSVILILMPLTLKDTFEGGAFLQILKLTQGDLYTQQDGGTSLEQLKDKQQQLQTDLEKYDPNVEVRIETMTSAVVTENDLSTSGFLMKRAKGNEDVVFEEGKSPKLKNEIALSATLAKLYDKTVGDSIEVSYEGKKNTYMITGIYASMMNLGNNMLASDEMEYEFAYTGFLIVFFSGDDAQKLETTKTVLQEYDDIKLIDIEDMVISFSGDMATQIRLMSDMMIGIIFFIIFAITILFSKMQIIKNKHSIAILQSLGYQRRDIRRIQMIRCFIQTTLGIGVGLLLHSLFTTRLLNFFFQIMGMGVINLEVNAFNAYVAYPIIFMIVVLLGQWLVNITIQKWNMKNLNEE